MGWAKRGGVWRRNWPSTPFTINRGSNQANGLVAWYPTISSRGTNILRDKAFYQDLTPVGTPAWTSESTVGSAFNSNGSSNAWSGAIPKVTEITNGLTVSLWVSDGSAGNATQRVLWQFTSGGILWARKSSTTLSFQTETNDPYAVNVSNFFTGSTALIHLAFVYEHGSTLYVYKNGVQVGSNASVSSNLSITSSTVYLGIRSNSTQYWLGSIADFRIYNRGMSASEVWQLWDPATRWDLYKPIEPRWTFSAATISPSASASASASASESASASASLSPSASESASPSEGYSDYTRGNYTALPADDADLENNYSAQDVTDVATSNDVRVGQTGAGEFMIHQYKNFVGSNSQATLTWEGQSDLAPSSSTIYLQIYNQNSTTWETVDSDSTSAADTDITLTAAVPDLTNYKDASNTISCRIYQEAT